MTQFEYRVDLEDIVEFNEYVTFVEMSKSIQKRRFSTAIAVSVCAFLFVFQ